MVSWWGADSYFNNDQDQIGGIELMNYVYGSSGSFGSRVRYTSIGHNTYTGRRINFHSNPIPIHGTVYKYACNYSYSRSNFSQLSQAFFKELIKRLSQKFSYASKIIDPVINLFSLNEVTFNLHICDHSIVTFGIGRLWLGFSNTSYVDILDMFIKSVVDNVKTDACI